MSDNPFDPFGTLPDNIRSESRRNIITNTLPGLLIDNYTITQAFNLYRDNGLGIRYSDFRTIWRNVTGEMAESTRIRYVRGDAIPSDAILRVADRPMNTRYRFIGQFEGINNNTGLRERFTATFETEEKDTINNMLDSFFDNLEENDSFSKYTVEEGSIIRGYIAP